MPNFHGTGVCRALLLTVVIASVALVWPYQPQAYALPASSWLKPDTPTFKTIKATVPPHTLPMYTYKDCSPHTKFITIPKNILKAQVETSYETCAIQTAFGHVSASDGNMRLFDTSLAGAIKTSTGSSRLVSGIPNSKHVMYASGGLYGAHRYIIKDLAENIDTVVQPNGSVIHKLKPGVSERAIKNAAGELIDFADTRFSDNGKWMIADVHQRGMTRVNVESGETLIFGAPYNYAVGTRPQFVSAISGDGRFAFVSANGYAILKIYDLSTCVLNTDPTRQAQCQAKELLPAATSQVGNFDGIYHAQFSTNTTLRLYIRYGGTYGYFTLTAPGESESRLDYLATGDSFASGEGAFSYKAGTDVREPHNTCHVSLLSYPYLLAARTNLNSAQSVACSGARLRDILSTTYPEELAQAKGKNSFSQDTIIANSYLPGYRPQMNFVESNKPAHVTISAAGNDIGFAKILLACIAPGTCYTDPQERLNLTHTINQQSSRLVDAYEALRMHASTGAHIYAIGYPLLAVPKGNCAVNVHLNPQEIEWTNQVITTLNSVIKSAAQKAGIVYVSVEQALAGHRLCETVSANVAVNGLTAGNDKTFSLPLGSNYTVDGYFTGQESYHPNQLGHRLLSEAIAAATRSFTMPNPASGTAPDSTGPTNLNVAITSLANLTPRKIIFEDGLGPSVLSRVQAHKLQARDLQPLTNTTLYIRSYTSEQSTKVAPVLVGAYQSSSTGTLDANVALPATLSVGLHELRLEAKNKTGEDIQIQKVVYVAQSSADIDGDSIINAQEKCLIVEPANLDTDYDAIDDACDPSISQEPTTSRPLPTFLFPAIFLPNSLLASAQSGIATPLQPQPAAMARVLDTAPVLGATSLAVLPADAPSYKRIFKPLLLKIVFLWLVLLAAAITTCAVYVLYRTRCRWQKRS